MVREDTLCILADELERQIEDIVIPEEDQKLSISITEETYDMFTPLRKLDPKQNGFTFEVLNDEKALISYLWGIFRSGDQVRIGCCQRLLSVHSPKHRFNKHEIVDQRRRTASNEAKGSDPKFRRNA